MDELLPSVVEIRALDESRTLKQQNHSQLSALNAPDKVVRAMSRLGLERFQTEVHIGNETTEYPRLEDSYAYELTIDPDKAIIRAKTVWGALAAGVTMAKMTREGHLPLCELIDSPCYPWRGLMIDTSRHFMQLERLRETLDLMALFQLNVLHLNLSNDQACRFASASAPKLAAADHYTCEELRNLVTYASDRGIRVVPEMDVPGHTTSWVWAYPEWGAGKLAGPSTGYGVHQACLDPTRPEVMDAIKQVFDDVAEVFPDEFVHVGGDEVNPAWWRGNSRILQWMENRSVPNTHALQTIFINEIGEHLRELGKKPIGWDEILHEDLHQDFVVQTWRGTNARDVAVQGGHATIVSSPYYLDLFFPADYHYRVEPNSTTQDVQAATVTSLTDHRLDHVSSGVAGQLDFGSYPSIAKRSGGSILGGEACMWSEIVDSDTLHTRVWSRMPAIAERFWRGAECITPEVMYKRLERSLARLVDSGRIPTLLKIPEKLNPARLKPLIEQLEPVKWYSRVIGVERMLARTSGQTEDQLKRPYDINTPLNRLVDYLPPESFAARRILNTNEEGDERAAMLNAWRSQFEHIGEATATDERLAELKPLSSNLARLADISEGKEPIDYGLVEPIGEYLLPIAKPVLDQALLRLLRPYRLAGKVTEIKHGHINDTFMVGERALVQRVNSSIFDAKAVIQNRCLLDEHICDMVPSILTTESEEDYVEGFGGEVWRASEYVPSRSFDVLPNALCREAGAAFGALLTKLKKCTDRPDPVIDGFHDLSHYLSELDGLPTSADCIDLIELVSVLRMQTHSFSSDDYQVIHGDCKVNNLLFDLEEDQVLKVVDLDTMMWGHPAWDFGDLIRSVLTGIPDRSIAIRRIIDVTAGFVENFEVHESTIQAFAVAPAHMSFMLGIRFLADHLRGDTYFKVSFSGENRERAAEQFDLTQWFLKNSDTLFKGLLRH